MSWRYTAAQNLDGVKHGKPWHRFTHNFSYQQYNLPLHICAQRACDHCCEEDTKTSDQSKRVAGVFSGYWRIHWFHCTTLLHSMESASVCWFVRKRPYWNFSQIFTSWFIHLFGASFDVSDLREVDSPSDLPTNTLILSRCEILRWQLSYFGSFQFFMLY